MNIPKTLSLIQNRFRNLKPVGPDVFRAERKSNGFTIGVFYFDFGQPLGKSTFKLHEYLQQVIATDFYQHEGSLQWNYYLYFILDHPLFNKLWKNGTTATIEADRVFARKFVKSEELFDKELTQPLAERVGTTHPPKDIATAWTKALIDGGLSKICDSKVPYTRVVEEFLSGAIVKSPYEFDTSSLTPAAAGRAIHKLQIKRFREHPLTKYYEFARVNLFRGPNGAGKTSLLEAIELSICGVSYDKAEISLLGHTSTLPLKELSSPNIVLAQVQAYIARVILLGMDNTTRRRIVFGKTSADSISSIRMRLSSSPREKRMRTLPTRSVLCS